MHDLPVLLCISADQLLLELRSRVLATRYQVIAAEGVPRLQALAKLRPRVDAAVLCHSLDRETCETIAGMVHRTWPEAALLLMTLRTSTPQITVQVDGRAGSLDGPLHLLSKIDALLHRQPTHLGSPAVL